MVARLKLKAGFPAGHWLVLRILVHDGSNGDPADRTGRRSDHRRLRFRTGANHRLIWRWQRQDAMNYVLAAPDARLMEGFF